MRASFVDVGPSLVACLVGAGFLVHVCLTEHREPERVGVVRVDQEPVQPLVMASALAARDEKPEPVPARILMRALRMPERAKRELSALAEKYVPPAAPARWTREERAAPPATLQVISQRELEPKELPALPPAGPAPAPAQVTSYVASREPVPEPEQAAEPEPKREGPRADFVRASHPIAVEPPTESDEPEPAPVRPKPRERKHDAPAPSPKPVVPAPPQPHPAAPPAPPPPRPPPPPPAPVPAASLPPAPAIVTPPPAPPPPPPRIEARSVSEPRARQAGPRKRVDRPKRPTPMTPEEATRYLAQAWVAVSGELPTPELLSVFWGQWALETGRGRWMSDYNFAGLKGRAPDGGLAHWWTWEETPQGPKRIRGRFRSYETAEEGAYDYVALLWHRYPKAVAAARRGDAVSFILELDQGGYFTERPAHYVRSVASLALEFRRKKLYASY